MSKRTNTYATRAGKEGKNMTNEPENNPPRPDRDCPNCRYKMPNGDCTQFDCNFAPKQYIVEEVQEWLAKTNNAGGRHFAK